MLRRLSTYTAIGALLLFGACSSSTDSGGGDDGGSAPPANNNMSTEAMGPSEWITGQQAELSFSASDADGLASVELSFTSPDGAANFSVTFQPSGTSWDTIWTAASSLAGTASISYTVEDAHSSNQETDSGSRDFPVQEPIAFSGTLGLSTSEDDSTFVPSSELEGIVQFNGSPKDTVYAQAIDAQLAIKAAEHNGERGFWMVPADDAYGSMQWEAVAKNTNGDEKRQAEALDVASRADGNFTITNNVTDQPVPAYLLIEKDGTVIDSLTSQNGQFNSVDLPGTNSTWVRAAQLRNGEAYSLEHRKELIHNGADVNKTIATINRDRRDINGNKTGEYTIDEMVNKLRRAGIEIHGNAPWVPLNENGGGGFPGILHRATEAANGIGYDKIIVPDTVNYVQQGMVHRHEDQVPGRVETEYTNQIKPLMGEFSTPLEFPEYYEYDTENRTPNIGVFLPREDITSFGLIAVKGKEPYVNNHSQASIHSDPDGNAMSDYREGQTILQEMTNGFIYFSKLASDDFSPEIFGPEESIIHDSTNRTTLSDYDRSIGWIVYEPTFQPGEKMSDLMYVPDSWK